MNGNAPQSGATLQIDEGTERKPKPGTKGTKELERDTIPNVPLGTSCRAFEAREWCSRERRQREAADLKTPMGAGYAQADQSSFGQSTQSAPWLRSSSLHREPLRVGRMAAAQSQAGSNQSRRLWRFGHSPE